MKFLISNFFEVFQFHQKLSILKNCKMNNCSPETQKERALKAGARPTVMHDIKTILMWK